MDLTKYGDGWVEPPVRVEEWHVVHLGKWLVGIRIWRGSFYAGPLPHRRILAHCQLIDTFIITISSLLMFPLLGHRPFLRIATRTGHNLPRGPSTGWWVLTTANAAGTNGLTCLPKHGARDEKFTHSMTDQCCLTSSIALLYYDNSLIWYPEQNERITLLPFFHRCRERRLKDQ
jgi:hypothetical protein